MEGWGQWDITRRLVEQFYNKHGGYLNPLDGGDWEVGEVVLQRILPLQKAPNFCVLLSIKLSLFFKFG